MTCRLRLSVWWRRIHFSSSACCEAWHFVSYREWDKGGVGLYSAATNSEGECLQQMSVLALATLYSRHIVCAPPLSCIFEPLLPTFWKGFWLEVRATGSKSSSQGFTAVRSASVLAVALVRLLSDQVFPALFINTSCSSTAQCSICHSDKHGIRMSHCWIGNLIKCASQTGCGWCIMWF